MGRFCDKKNYVMNRENYGHQKMNLIIPSKEKNEKKLDFKNCLWLAFNVFSYLKKKDKFSCQPKSLGFSF